MSTASGSNNAFRAASLKHKQMLNDLARQGMEPSDPVIRAKYEQFRADVTDQALKFLKERIPAKILHFNERVNVNTPPGEQLHCRGLELFQAPDLLASGTKDGVEDGGGTAPKRARVDLKVSGTDAGESKSSPPMATVGVHEQIVELEEMIRKEALELVEMVGTVKLWIQLNVPRIEDGNNFGVAIQEEAIQELGRVEDAAFNLCDGIKYHSARAKIISKVAKYPHIEDYARAVVEMDQKEWLHLKVSLLDMRNSYSMLYELLHKNWEKVVKPRTADGIMMVM